VNFTFNKSKKVTKPLDVEHVKKNIIIKYKYTRDNRRYYYIIQIYKRQ